jgi:site-specific recombinase XerD
MKNPEAQKGVIQKECYSGFVAELKRRGAAERSISAYCVDLGQFFRFHGLSFRDVTQSEIASLPPDAVTSFVSALVEGGGEFTTARRHLSSLRTFYDYLVTRGFLQENPARGIRLSSLSGNLLSEEKILKIFEYLSAKDQFGGEPFRLRDELILLFMLFLGVKSYWIPKLTLSDLRKGDPAPVLRVSRKKSLPVDGAILERLREYLKIRPQGSMALFASHRKDHAIPLSALESLLAKVSSGIGEDLSHATMNQTSLWLQQNPERSNEILAKIGR